MMPDRIPADAKTLARYFANRSVPTNQIAFYNDPAFMAAIKVRARDFQ